ncbi:MAG: amylo-alpha-1,6-glucosidase [Candidatus Altiarchaeota archaeon]
MTRLRELRSSPYSRELNQLFRFVFTILCMGVLEDFNFRGCMILQPRQLGLDSARRIEWLIPNGIGGYSSSTILGLNTRKYHGLLVASRGLLDRRVVVESLVEELLFGDIVFNLSVDEYAGGMDSRGLPYIKRVVKAVEHVKFEYDVNGTNVVKIIHATRGVNGLIISYGVRNNFGGSVRLRVKPLVNCRSVHELNPQGRDFKSSLQDRALVVECGQEHTIFASREMVAESAGAWCKDMHYWMEAERGEASNEDVFNPGSLTLTVPPYGLAEAEVRVAWGMGKDDALRAYKALVERPYQTFEADPASILDAAASSFIIDAGGKKTIVAGYHWFSDWGRDAMISLPGLCLVSGRLNEAEAVLSRFIDYMRDGRIPTQITVDGPIYYDFDGTLWMLDSLNEYCKYAGQERALGFIRQRWGSIKSVIEWYSKLVEGGLLRHRSGTWMDTIERDDAVEVQALWYNGLNVVEELSNLIGEPVDYSLMKSDFESSFMEKYWNGSYLNDCLNDDSLRPNQVIAAGLEYSPVPKNEAAQLIKAVNEELLTPCGLRTLGRKDPQYRPQYVGGFEDRAHAYQNGTVWPWLFGPYADTVVRLGGARGSRHAIKVITPLLNRVCDNCLGTLNEIYDAEEPHTPRGAVSQAWSVAEILRVLQENKLAK